MLLAGLTILILLINPVGFIGGGMDDWQYLNAARCWREFGPCLPHDHWQARWPVIAPIALLSSVFGESRTTVELPFLIAALSCVLLLVRVGNRLFGSPIGWIAAAFLLLTPVFALQLMEPSVEAIELGFMLAGLFFLLRWLDDPNSSTAFGAALLFSMAIQVRETSLTAAAFAVGIALIAKPQAALKYSVTAMFGFAIPFVTEFVWFWAATGDPFWRLKLDLGHTQIPSSELRGPIDHTRGPLFNRNYIAHWKFQPGIHVHWLLDGLLNLFANAYAGLSLALVPLLALFARARGERKVALTALRIWALAMLYACVLIFVFAVDPKPRMMMVPLCLTNMALALLLWHLRDLFRATCIAITAVCGSVAGVLLITAPSLLAAEQASAQWIAAYPGKIEIDENTRRHLALIPSAQNLPGVDSQSEFLIYKSVDACDEWLSVNGLPRDSLETIASVPGERWRWPVHVFWPGISHPLCLYRYQHPIAGEAIRTAFRRSRNDGPYMIGSRGL